MLMSFFILSEYSEEKSVFMLKVRFIMNEKDVYIVDKYIFLWNL